MLPQSSQCDAHDTRFTMRCPWCNVHDGMITMQSLQCDVHDATSTMRRLQCDGHHTIHNAMVTMWYPQCSVYSAMVAMWYPQCNVYSAMVTMRWSRCKVTMQWSRCDGHDAMVTMQQSQCDAYGEKVHNTILTMQCPRCNTIRWSQCDSHDTTCGIYLIFWVRVLIHSRHRGGSVFLSASYNLIGWDLAYSLLRQICTHRGKINSERMNTHRRSGMPSIGWCGRYASEARVSTTLNNVAVARPSWINHIHG